MLNTEQIIELAKTAFAEEAKIRPPMSLRAGAAIDSYDLPPPFDPELDKLTAAYIETHAYYALPHLDALSWRHYMPYLIEYALRNLAVPETMVPDGLVGSLRPPDREPPRLGSLSHEQKKAVTAFLEFLCFGESNFCEDIACRALEEYWTQGAEYRKD